MQPLILITNDDGIASPGLHAAAESVAHLGELLIVAPHTQQTSMSRARPVGPHIGIIASRPLTIQGTTYPAYAVHGSPAQSVLHAILELAPRRPDVCISGINYGENLGASITRSGTVGAALEASSFGIPSLAISTSVALEQQHSSSYAVINWQIASYFTRVLTTWLLSQKVPQEIAVFNVNVPKSATEKTPLRMTKQSRQNYYEEKRPPQRDTLTPYHFPSFIHVESTRLEPESDIYAFVIDSVVSVTPLSLDLTAKLSQEQWMMSTMKLEEALPEK